jgi:hypothetical protein
MLRITVLAAAAAFALFGTLASEAAPLDRPPFSGGDSIPIEPGVLDPVNDCLRFPSLCEPTEPPPDPCVTNPGLCPDPPPPCTGRFCPNDFCERFPVLCEDLPVLEPADPPVADPGDEEPGDEEPGEQETFDHSLAGNARVKVNGAKATEAYTLLLNVDTTARTFSAMDGDGTLYTGNLAPKGTKGVKFSLFLDAASSDALEADVAGRVAAAPGVTPAPLGGSAKLTLRLNEDGTVSLKIKSEVLVAGVGEVVFKANLVSQPQ